jgi:hypothetical protein
VTSSPVRRIVLLVVVGTLAAGAFYFVRSFRPPEGGDREMNVADAPAGGRTQATLPEGEGGAPPIDVLDDPLVAGIPEAPDIPASAAHRGLKKIGERIRDAVLADGTIGDDEVPGVDLAGLSPAQRRWFVEQAPTIACGCGCGQDLLECRRDDVSCPTSPGIRDSLLAVARARGSR